MEIEEPKKKDGYWSKVSVSLNLKISKILTCRITLRSTVDLAVAII
jgi:transcriptional regulator of met regulon